MSAGIRARLFDDDGRDREVDLREGPVAAPTERQLLWVDVDRSQPGALEALAALDDVIRLDESGRASLAVDRGRASVAMEKDRLHLTVESLEDGDDPVRLERRAIALLVGPDVVVSVHDGPAAAIERFVDGFEGDTHLGALTAADLLSSLVDEVLIGYLDLVERIERDIDDLDERALHGRHGDDLLAAIVALRRRVSRVRRALAPHRGAVASLGRPELRLEERIGRPWPRLVDRVETAMDAIEGARDALLGTYDVHMGRTAQRANDVMRILTLLSAVLLPAVVLAGIMGMNFPLPFFEDPGNATLVMGAMAGFALAILLIARWRHWL